MVGQFYVEDKPRELFGRDESKYLKLLTKRKAVLFHDNVQKIRSLFSNHKAGGFKIKVNGVKISFSNEAAGILGRVFSSTIVDEGSRRTQVGFLLIGKASSDEINVKEVRFLTVYQSNELDNESFWLDKDKSFNFPGVCVGVLIQQRLSDFFDLLNHPTFHKLLNAKQHFLFMIGDSFDSELESVEDNALLALTHKGVLLKDLYKVVTEGFLRKKTRKERVGESIKAVCNIFEIKMEDYKLKGFRAKGEKEFNK